MSRFLNAAGYNFRFMMLPHLLAALVIFALIPVVFSVSALDAAASALPIELGLPFIGVALLTPVYASEQESGILDTVLCRKTPYLLILCMRIALALVLTAVLICGFVLLMSALESEVTLVHAPAAFANAVFLGGLGILVSAVCGHAVIGYMAPLLYYVLDLMGGLGSFTLFSLIRNGTTEGKLLIFFIGIGCIVLSLICRRIRLKR